MRPRKHLSWWLLIYWAPILWTAYVLVAVGSVELLEQVAADRYFSLYRLAIPIHLMVLALALGAWVLLLVKAYRRKELGWCAGIFFLSLFAMPLYGRHRHWERP